MPELPEVTTTVQGLQKVLVGATFSDVWTDLAKKHPIEQFKNTLKDETFFTFFKKEIVGKKVISVERRAKNILIHIEGGQTILIHLKMTGHLLWGKYVQKQKTWTPAPEEKNEALRDPFNKYIHVVFSLTNGMHVVFCDSRKFGKVTLLNTETIHNTKHLKGIGPEPLDPLFTARDFKNLLQSIKSNKAIKTVLMDQYTIAGIGNIYSDEMLYKAHIHPQSNPAHIPEKQINKLYVAMKEVLIQGIDFGGDSMSDYRNIYGERGAFQHKHNAYRKTGSPCTHAHCRGTIQRKIIGGRSAHFCPLCQILY